MGNSFESDKFFTGKDHEESLCLVSTVCKENRDKCQNVGAESSGDAPIFVKERPLSKRHVNEEKRAKTFGKGRALSQPPVNTAEINDTKTSPILEKERALSERTVNEEKRAQTFEKGRVLSQPPVYTATTNDTGTSRVPSTQPNSERLGSSKIQVLSSAGQSACISEIDSKDKEHWYREYKHQKGKVRRLTKDLERSNTKLRKISSGIKVLSDMVK